MGDGGLGGRLLRRGAESSVPIPTALDTEHPLPGGAGVPPLLSLVSPGRCHLCPGMLILMGPSPLILLACSWMESVLEHAGGRVSLTRGTQCGFIIEMYAVPLQHGPQ